MFVILHVFARTLFPQMPRLDGWGLCEEIRKISSQSKTTIIGMSAAGSNNDEKAVKAGMDGFMIKPFRLDELMGLIAAKTSRKAAVE